MYVCQYIYNSVGLCCCCSGCLWYCRRCKLQLMQSVECHVIVVIFFLSFFFLFLLSLSICRCYSCCYCCRSWSASNPVVPFVIVNMACNMDFISIRKKNKNKQPNEQNIQEIYIFFFCPIGMIYKCTHISLLFSIYRPYIQASICISFTLLVRIPDVISYFFYCRRTIFKTALRENRTCRKQF